MSIAVAFFSAPDDASASEAERRPGGPLGWPVQIGTRKVGLFRKEPVVEAAAPAYDGFPAHGYDGAVNMGTLEELLTGAPYGSLENDPRWGGRASEDEAPENCGVLTLTDTLRDAFANADDQALESIVKAWARTEELAPFDGSGPSEEDVEQHLKVLMMLRDLGVRAQARGQHLYWYFEM